MKEDQQLDKPLRDLLDIIHFTENVSGKIHGVLDEAEIYRTVREEFAQSKRYTVSISLLTPDRSKLRVAEVTISPEKVKQGEKLAGLRIGEYEIDLNKSSIYSHVVREGATVQVDVSQILGELFPRPLAFSIAKVMGYEKRPSIITPLKRHGEIIGAFAMSSVELAEHFMPSVRNFAQHITDALELADEYTERKAAEEALKERSQQLEATLEELRDAQEELIRKERLAVLGQLAGGVGHELRHPLGVISNAVYYLNMTLPDADETTKEYLEIISSEVRNADKIISDLLGFSRTRLPEREAVSVSELVSEVLERQPPPESVKVSTHTPTDLPPVFVDPRQMEQVLVNLVINAYQAMPEGGELTIKARAEEDKVHLSVTDTGVGVSPENMEKLFEPLFTNKARGIGLGLPVSKILLEANGGTIEVESEEGKGSTFTVTLPTEEGQV